MVGHSDYGESDRIVRLLTPEHGRVSALARAARRSTKRFGGALDPGSRVDAALRPGSGSLWHLDEAALIDGRLGARRDLGLVGLLGYATELCAGLAREHHSEPRLFGLLDMAGLLLGAMSGPPGALFRLALEAKALTFAGFQPALDRCAICDLAIEDPMMFSPVGGGAVHLACAASGGVHVSLDWLVQVERARRTPLKELIDVPAPAGPAWALSDAVTAHLGQPLRSRAVLDALMAARPADAAPPADKAPPAEKV